MLRTVILDVKKEDSYFGLTLQNTVYFLRRQVLIKSRSWRIIDLILRCCVEFFTIETSFMCIQMEVVPSSLRKEYRNGGQWYLKSLAWWRYIDEFV